jgi:hypothetical protein
MPSDRRIRRETVCRSVLFFILLALRRLPSEGGPKGIPVFKDDAKDVYGGALGLDPSPIVSEADLIKLHGIR